jgi:transposase
MPKSRPPYPLEFKQRMVEFVRAGRTPEELAEEFEPSAQAIRNWVKQADLDQGDRSDGLTADERGELQRLRRENKQLKMEREILKIGIRVREGEPGGVSGATDVPYARPFAEWFLFVGRTVPVGSDP